MITPDLKNIFNSLVSRTNAQDSAQLQFLLECIAHNPDAEALLRLADGCGLQILFDHNMKKGDAGLYSNSHHTIAPGYEHVFKEPGHGWMPPNPPRILLKPTLNFPEQVDTILHELFHFAQTLFTDTLFDSGRYLLITLPTEALTLTHLSESTAMTFSLCVSKKLYEQGHLYSLPERTFKTARKLNIPIDRNNPTALTAEMHERLVLHFTRTLPLSYKSNCLYYKYDHLSFMRKCIDIKKDKPLRLEDWSPHFYLNSLEDKEKQNAYRQLVKRHTPPRIYRCLELMDDLVTKGDPKTLSYRFKQTLLKAQLVFEGVPLNHGKEKRGPKIGQ